MEEYIEKQAVLRFCQGCQNREAGLQVLQKRPQTMEEAVNALKWAIFAINSMSLGKSTYPRVFNYNVPNYVAEGPRVNSTSFCPGRDQRGTTQEVNVCQAGRWVPFSEKPERTTTPSPEDMTIALRENTRAMEQLKIAVEGIRTEQSATLRLIESIAMRLVQADSRPPVTGPPMESIQTEVRGRSPYRMSRSITPPRNASRSPGRGCFVCGVVGHFQRDCPHKQVDNSTRPVSEPDKSPEVSLNSQGSRK